MRRGCLFGIPLLSLEKQKWLVWDESKDYIQVERSVLPLLSNEGVLNTLEKFYQNQRVSNEVRKYNGVT